MALFLRFLRQRKRIIYIFLVFCAIFAVTFALYHLPIRAVIYPAALCLGLSIVLLAADWLRMRRLHAYLAEAQRFSADLTFAFPDTNDVIERDYQEIIRLLIQEQRANRAEANARFADMVDYYTVWAHQIKTPIASMRLTLSGEDSELARKLSGELFRIEQYVEMAMMFLRLDSDSTDYVIRTCRLDDIVRAAVRKFADEFILRRLSLSLEVPETQVLTDEKWLSFVIEQVLSNALKYTRSGGIFITLGENETLCIRDTGIGIASEDLPRIFEKGFTGYNGRDNMKASGIGLYLCRRICGNLGHTISAESVPGQGTAIRICLHHENRILE